MLHQSVALIGCMVWHMSEHREDEGGNRYKVGRRFFVYAPPLKGVRPSKRKPPNPPHKGAPAWKCSVYYFWWEYLRRHEGYRQCCEQGGKGEYAALYADFGDVHAHDDFWRWWSKEGHSELFCEPTARQIYVLDEKGRFDPTVSHDTLILSVPLEVRTAYLVKGFRSVLKQQDARARAARSVSRARYPVATKPVLTSLYQHLIVWDARKENPKLKLYELYDLVHAQAGLYVSERVEGETVAELRKLELNYNNVLRTVRQRKANIVQRHLRIAEQYILNTGLGRFPLRESR
jgi:hypothetical protein